MNFNYVIERNNLVILGVNNETTADLIAALIRKEIGGNVKVFKNEW